MTPPHGEFFRAITSRRGGIHLIRQSIVAGMVAASVLLGGGPVFAASTPPAAARSASQEAWEAAPAGNPHRGEDKHWWKKAKAIKWKHKRHGSGERYEGDGPDGRVVITIVSRRVWYAGLDPWGVFVRVEYEVDSAPSWVVKLVVLARSGAR